MISILLLGTAIGEALSDHCQRVIAIGDLHGEWHHTLRIMRASKLISDDKEPNWIADERTCLIQLGDLVDRGEFSKKLYDLFDRLREQANGRVVNLLGNHELMNLMGDMRYTTPEEDAHWGGAEERLRTWQGKWSRQLVTVFRAAEVINGILFVHAGLHAKFGDANSGNITTLQHTVRDALLHFNTYGSFPPGTNSYFGENGPLWTRDFLDAEEISCPLLMNTLKTVNARRMVVGHTQVSGGIKSFCGGHLIAIDTIVSEAGYPACWGPQASIQTCKGVATFLEFIDNKTYANEVSPRGKVEIVERRRIALYVKQSEL